MLDACILQYLEWNARWKSRELYALVESTPPDTQLPQASFPSTWRFQLLQRRMCWVTIATSFPGSVAFLTENSHWVSWELLCSNTWFTPAMATQFQRQWLPMELLQLVRNPSWTPAEILDHCRRTHSTIPMCPQLLAHGGLDTHMPMQRMEFQEALARRRQRLEH